MPVPCDDGSKVSVKVRGEACALIAAASVRAAMVSFMLVVDKSLGEKFNSCRSNGKAQ